MDAKRFPKPVVPLLIPQGVKLGAPAGSYAAAAYDFLRKLVGCIALAMPWTVIFGDALIRWIGPGPVVWRDSISQYYYSRTGNVFVGSLCALAVFFFAYDYRPKPGDDADNLVSNVAAFAAIGVAMLPTRQSGVPADDGSRYVGWGHFTCAGTLFALLAWLALVHFTKTENGVDASWTRKRRMLRIFRTDKDEKAEAGPRKLTRNLLYRVFGWGIVAASVYTAVAANTNRPIIVSEFVAVECFALAWLVKGKTFPFLNDPGTPAPAIFATVPADDQPMVVAAD